MDLLGSILGSMEKPPENKEKKKAMEQKRLLEKMQQQERQKLSEFRAKIEKRIGEFVKDGAQKNFKFEPMHKTYRAIVHEVADVAGLISFSFGQDEINRYVMLWKKEYAPCDEELLAYRNEEEWDPEKAQRLKAEKATEDTDRPVRKRKPEVTPQHDYHQEYEHLLGKETARDAARLTAANKSYGFVPSENKRDHRTIEEVLAESKAKRQRTETTDASLSADVSEQHLPDSVTSDEINSSS